MPKLTICFPVYNEVHYIDNLLKSVYSCKSPDREIIIIDGGSTDGTIDKVRLWQKQHSNLRLIKNEKKIVSSGFNKAFYESNSEYIALMGAHAEYPPDYFEIGVSYLKRNECDVVGGPLMQKGRGFKGKVIAACMSCTFGVGDTEFRTSKEKKYVDSVAFAIYNRRIFEKAGMLDEELIRNQDDEFHYRLNSMGFKILMIPDMQSIYYVRENILSLWKQYFQYGLYKPMVFHKVKSSMHLRHIIPSFFVVYLLLLPVLVKVSFLFFFPFLLYLVADLIVSIKISKNIKGVLYSIIIFPVLHISYGIGFLYGLLRLYKSKVR